MMSSTDKLKVGLIALVGALVVAFGSVAQYSIFRYAAQTHVDVEALKTSLREEVQKGWEQEKEISQQRTTIAVLSSDVKEAKKEARRSSKVIITLPTPALPIPVVVATPVPTVVDTNPKHGWGWK